MSNIVYDRAGVGYNNTRCADPYLAGRLYEMLSPVAGGIYLDIGCGTGNYLTALAEKGIRFYGIDPSETMLKEARLKNNNAVFINAHAEHIPIDNNFFDGAIATFTLHHWKDMQRGLTEVNRVLKPGAKLVMLSFTPEQLMGYWLHHYFPRMIERSLLTPPLPEMETILNNSGFTLSYTEKYFVKEDLQDHFLYSNKSRPEQYLRPEVRNGASSFTVFSEPEELSEGLIALESEIKSGKITEVMKKYENDFGDYLFLVGTKE